MARDMKITRIFAHRVACPSTKAPTSGPAASPSPSSTAPSSAWRPTRASSARARSARWVRSICRRMPGRARRLAELGPHLLGRPDGARQAQPSHGRRPQGPSLRQGGIDIACWDILGKAPAAGLHAAGRRFGDVRLYRAISQEAPEAMAARVAGYRAQG